MESIYLDHAATTQMRPEVLQEMMPYLTEKYGNPSSTYLLGQENKNAIEMARTRVKKAIGANEFDRIIFTSGGSEADNMALKGIAHAKKNLGRHIITTPIEHSAILKTCEQLKKEGFSISFIEVDSTGLVKLESLKKLIRSDTILISVMLANNEIGTIEPIKEISQIAHQNQIIFHVDAVQGVGSMKIDVQELGVDLLSMSAHKFYGPKGVGALYVRKGIDLEPLISGGHQEEGKRGGTENVAGIVGMGKAIEIANNQLDSYSSRISSIRNKLYAEIQRNIRGVSLNGHPHLRHPGNIHLSIDGIDGRVLVLLLSEQRIFLSHGSACNSKESSASHVLKAIGMNEDKSKSAIRISLGVDNKEEQIDYLVEKIKNVTEHYRKSLK